MPISTNRYYERSNSQFQTLQSRVDKLQEQISTGKKVLTPSDDAVAYQRLQGLKQAGTDDAAWQGNITLAKTILQDTDSTLGNITDRLQQLQELAVQATTGTLSTSDRQALANNVRSAIQDLVGLANTKDVRGQPLFGAATGNTAVTVDPTTGAVSFSGTGSPASIPIGNGTSVQPSDTAERIFGNIPASAGGTTDTFALLSSFADALESGAPVSNAILTDLGAAVNQVTNVRSAAGARSARLDVESARLTDVGLTRETERSALEDTDITTAITELQKTSTVLQATQASFSKFSQLSLFDYIK